MTAIVLVWPSVMVFYLMDGPFGRGRAMGGTGTEATIAVVGTVVVLLALQCLGTVRAAVSWSRRVDAADAPSAVKNALLPEDVDSSSSDEEEEAGGTERKGRPDHADKRQQAEPLVSANKVGAAATQRFATLYAHGHTHTCRSDAVAVAAVAEQSDMPATLRACQQPINASPWHGWLFLWWRRQQSQAHEAAFGGPRLQTCWRWWDFVSSSFKCARCPSSPTPTSHPKRRQRQRLPSIAHLVRSPMRPCQQHCHSSLAPSSSRSPTSTWTSTAR